MSVRSPYDFLRSPYDSRTMSGVRPSKLPNVYNLTVHHGFPERKRQAFKKRKHHSIIQMRKTNLDRNKPHALKDRIVQFFEDRPYFYDICFLSRKIPVPVGNGTDFSSCAPLKTHLDHEILLPMVYPFSGTYFRIYIGNTQIVLFLICSDDRFQ